MTQSKIAKVLIACGGTGGHVFPGISIAEEFVGRDSATQIVFVGTKRGIEKDIIANTSWRLIKVYAPSIKDKKLFLKLFTFMTLPVSIYESYRVIKKEAPDMVIGVGGYASGSIIFVASLMRRITAIVEPNAIAGFTNRILGRFVAKVYTGFSEAGELFPKNKVLMTGNPVRKEILSVRNKKQINRNETTIFCLGGSQGAVAVNRLIVEALPFLADNKRKFKFIHQAGKKDDLEKIRASYKKYNFEAEVYDFVDRIWEIYEKADLVVGRSGATTIGELLAVGLPAIFIPYPSAADDHQWINAQGLSRCGGAVVLRQDCLN
ncbi:MAG: undecaprenyldiphospho-muramoylpentapeptide beta-N-acetylglucosaminyltransferase, partial [Deltaproteobacteria bacterium CG07_land_8_20_14_0_80_38_7]